MASAKPLIIVLAILVGRVKIVLFVLKTLAVNMDTVTNHLNAIVNQVGLDRNVKEVELAILLYYSYMQHPTPSLTLELLKSAILSTINIYHSI